MKALIAVSLLLCACFPSDMRFLTTLSKSGYRSPRLGERVYFSCAEQEYGMAFSAINPAGERVEGVVCCGPDGWGTKACTVRF